VFKVILLFKNGEFGSHGGVRGRVRKGRMDLHRSCASGAINNVHNLAFAAGELGSSMPFLQHYAAKVA
jgi:hypothetical protein